VSSVPTVRPFATEDAPAVAMLEALCNPIPWQLEDILPFADWQSNPESSSFVRLGLIALSGGKVAGYLLASSIAGQAEILVLGVHPDARRKGIARALLQNLFAHLKLLENDTVYLEVRIGNHSATGLYESLAFTRTGIRKGYYGDNGEDAALYRRDVSGTFDAKNG
jgi:ribosomal-protein-alanine N-acetyltransferase